MVVIKKMLALIVMMASLQSFAQYKKASFLEKDGRTYELGMAGHFMNKGRSATPGVYFSIGRETNKKLFFWYDFELLMAAKFKTTGIETYTLDVKSITGKTKPAFILSYNWGYFLTDNNSEEAKIFPFLTAGINTKIGGGLTLDAANQDEIYDNFEVAEFSGSVGLNFGAGSIFNLSNQLSFKLAAGYNYQLPRSIFESFRGKNIVYADYISHPYASLSLRFKINKEE